MAVKLRLTRVGAKKAPKYRIVAADMHVMDVSSKTLDTMIQQQIQLQFM